MLLGVVFGLLALEVVMQVGAYWNWRTLRAVHRSETARDGAHTVLCVGDSFTYGLGAASREASYPARLAQRLEQAAPRRYAVLNRGVPGASSADLLRRLDEHLRTHAPHTVCVLIGYNDPTSLDPEVTVAEARSTGDAPAGFEWRWRTKALIQRIVRHFDEQGSAETGGAELIGDWHADGAGCTFLADGTLRFLGIVAPWRVDGEVLHFGSGDDRRTVQWRLRGDRLHLRGDDLPGGALVLQRGPPPGDALDVARRALARGELEAADAALAGAATALRESVPGRALAAELAHRAGDARRRDDALAGLRADPSPAARAALAGALLATRRLDEGVPTALQELATDPSQPELWRGVFEAALTDARFRDRVLAAADRAAAALRDSPDQYAAFLATRSNLRLLAGEPTVALGDALLAGVASGDWAVAVRLLRRHREALDDPTVERVLQALDLSGPARTSARDAIDRALADAGSVASVYARHLQAIASLCRQRGATLVLLTYPEPMRDLEPVLREFARGTGTPLIDTQQRFAETTLPRADLFIADGHCTDRGYDWIAEAVAAHLLAKRGSR